MIISATVDESKQKVPSSSERAHRSRLCVLPSLEQIMQLNTTYILVEYAMVVITLNFYLEENT